MISLPRDEMQCDIDGWLQESRDILLPYPPSFRPRIPRPIRQFMEEEVVCPTGPKEGHKFRVRYLPWTGVWLDELHNPWWHEFALKGPSQGGKSMCGFLAPLLYHLFELAQTVVCGVPILDIADDKFEEDIEPILRKTRFWDLVPGIRKLKNDPTIRFHNGATLKFMSGGGSDKRRASFTSTVAIFTEVNAMAHSDSTSHEANKIKQILARLRSEARENVRAYYECTEEIEECFIHQAVHVRGSDSRILMQCPHCREHVLPERENLKGWEDARDVIEVEEQAYWECPSCQHSWTERDRAKANRNLKLVHRGQQIIDGEVVGEMPRTRLLGVRFTASHNLFKPAKDPATDEFNKQFAEDPEDAEREACQFVFSIPYTPTTLERIRIDVTETAKRTEKYPKDFVPSDAKWLTLGVDVGKYRAHYVAGGLRPAPRKAHIVTYGTVEFKMLVDGKLLDANSLGFDVVFRHCMGAFRERLLQGFNWGGEGELAIPDEIWIDCRYQGEEAEETVFETVKEWHDSTWICAQGQGSAHYASRGRYRKPQPNQKHVLKMGHEYHIVWDEKACVRIVKVNSDKWKTIVQNGLTKDSSQAGAIVLYDAIDEQEHKTYIRHCAAEHQETEYILGKGLVQTWKTHSSANHYGDATYLMMGAGHNVGFRLKPVQPSKPAMPPVTNQRRMPDGRPYSVLSR